MSLPLEMFLCLSVTYLTIVRCTFSSLFMSSSNRHILLITELEIYMHVSLPRWNWCLSSFIKNKLCTHTRKISTQNVISNKYSYLIGKFVLYKKKNSPRQFYDHKTWPVLFSVVCESLCWPIVLLFFVNFMFHQRCSIYLDCDYLNKYGFLY